MAKKRLTDRFVASVKAPKDVVQVDYFDEGFPALALRVGHREKTWTLHRRDNGILKRVKLGRFPEMSLADAREAWRQNRLGLLTVNNMLVKAVVAEWLGTWEHGKAVNTVKSVRGQVSRVILPAWGARNISEISKRDVTGMLDGFKDKPRTARHLFSTLRQLFDFCLQREIIKVDPMAGLRKKNFGVAPDRDRVLNDDELATLMRWCRGTNEYDPNRASALLLILTGARSDMIASLRWDEINGTMISFGGERMKTGVPFELPITAQMRTIIDTIPRTSSPLVFRNGVLNDKAKMKLDAATGLTNWQWRDIRRTVSTGMQRLGVSSTVIDAVQAHAMTGVKRVYQRHHFAAEKREAMDRWGEFVASLG